MNVVLGQAVFNDSYTKTPLFRTPRQVNFLHPKSCILDILWGSIFGRLLGLGSWQAARLAGWPAAGLLAGWVQAGLAGWLAGWLLAWLAGWLPDWLADWLATGLPGRLAGCRFPFPVS